ncbi:MAG: hypothetical protein L6V93_06695 [Clostridiales bacterium]|nr:MAG: hypothetical protein L6V93_06695 [Clostridiales bacterium]
MTQSKKIAAEKCGIIKQNSRVAVYKMLDKDAEKVVHETVKNTNSHLVNHQKLNIIKSGIVSVFLTMEFTKI